MPDLSGDAKGQWRPMRETDLPRVQAVADRVHPAFPEDAKVFAERLRLYPDGCLVFSRDAEITAYGVSHPWRANNLPVLNSLLDELPREPSTYYIHDLALLPDLRGTGAAALAVALMVARARKERLPTMSLVAVNDSIEFWRRQGFEKVADARLTWKLRSYEAAASYMVRAL